MILGPVAWQIPPTVNHYWLGMMRKTKKGKTFAGRIVSPDGKAYRDYVKAMVWQARAHKQSRNPIVLTIGIHPHNNGRYDISNRLKPLEDALVDAGVMVDDKQVVDIRMVRLPVITGSRLMLVVEEDLAYDERAMLALFDPGRYTRSRPSSDELTLTRSGLLCVKRKGAG